MLNFAVVLNAPSHFTDQFEKKAAERGYDFYCEGRVKSVFNINGIEWMAIVQAYDDHVVQLKIENDKVTAWECNCSDKEDPCKHIIAVYHFLREEGHRLKNTDTTGFEQIRENIAYMPPHVLRYLILKYAAENKTFRSFLVEWFDTDKEKKP